MHRRNAVIALVCACAVVVMAGAIPAKAAFLTPLFGFRKPEPSLVFVYHGWRIDASRTARVQRPAKTVRAIRAQIDTVEHVGLSPEALAFMRTQPIIGDPATTGEPGRYVRGRGVFLRVKGLDDKRPIVLRQLLYAYQDQKLPGGFANHDVARFRLEAMGKHVWPKAAAMLHSDPDYFAMTASAYLYGAITREPYTRADLHRTQPDAYQWLAKLFDGGRPRT
jgi:hypothetical protein